MMHRKAIIFSCIVLGTAFLLEGGHVFASCLEGQTNCEEGVTVSLSVTSTYQGTSAITGSFYTDGSTYYTNTPINEITLGATETSTYTVTGDITTPLAGSGVGSYTTQETIELVGPDGPKNLFVLYDSAGEPYVTPPLALYLDTTPPTTPDAISPFAGETVDNEGILFSRTTSTDGGSGLKEYVLTVSLSPTMADPYIFVTEQNSLIINQTLLPEGGLYWTITAIDNVDNESTSIPSFFTAAPARKGIKSTIDTLIPTDPTDGVPESENFLDEENTEIIDHNEVPDELLLVFDDGMEHLLDDTGIPDNVDQKVTYIFQVDKKPSIIEIIKKNNEIQVLINQLQADRHLVVTSEIIGTLSNTEGSLKLPRYLFRTGADLRELQYHLTLLSKYFPDASIRQQLLTIIHYIMPYRWGGAMMMALLLCYDIETYKQRLLAFYRKS